MAEPLRFRARLGPVKIEAGYVEIVLRTTLAGDVPRFVLGPRTQDHAYSVMVMPDTEPASEAAAPNPPSG